MFQFNNFLKITVYEYRSATSNKSAYSGWVKGMIIIRNHNNDEIDKVLF